MPRTVEQLTATDVESPDRGTRYEHPAFAQIQASRVTSSAGVPL